MADLPLYLSARAAFSCHSRFALRFGHQPGVWGFCDNRTVSESTTPSRIALVTGTVGRHGTYVADATGMNPRLLDAKRCGHEARRANS